MDRMIRCITSNGAIMAAAVDSTYLVATAHQVHNTSPVATAALGRLLTGASIMGSMLKKENATLTLKINGGGPLGSVVAIADSHGNCRGYVEHPEVDLPLKPNGKLDVGRAVGNDGLLGVLRDFGEGQPYMGQVEIISGEIAEDITHYYATSEQIPTVCALGVLVGKEDKNQILAGGLLIQVLPGASEADIDQLEKNISTLEPVTTMLAKGMTIEEMCKTALQGFELEILDEYQMCYVCTCSKERVRNALITLRPEELRTLADETGKMEAKCQYCNRAYQFTVEELEALADSLEKKRAEKN
ncbi:Hsp33 family molecular chaperone HslO [Anaeromassilibacillus senegalensis]|uniref:Hsp33 family molecular chaperone HslO n=1 Tax=Anaeromassilibacillus senegalensis TaxID=1673717 RepID=UPI0006834CF7|nr:Hsp33 family molecular chaperone HslO [Anaeromassilibacillus senegalensis]